MRQIYENNVLSHYFLSPHDIMINLLEENENTRNLRAKNKPSFAFIIQININEYQSIITNSHLLLIMRFKIREKKTFLYVIPYNLLKNIFYKNFVLIITNTTRKGLSNWCDHFEVRHFFLLHFDDSFLFI